MGVGHSVVGDSNGGTVSTDWRSAMTTAAMATARTKHAAMATSRMVGGRERLGMRSSAASVSVRSLTSSAKARRRARSSSSVSGGTVS